MITFLALKSEQSEKVKCIIKAVENKLSRLLLVFSLFHLSLIHFI